jgi:hypothetical protein
LIIIISLVLKQMPYLIGMCTCDVVTSADPDGLIDAVVPAPELVLLYVEDVEVYSVAVEAVTEQVIDLPEALYEGFVL